MNDDFDLALVADLRPEAALARPQQLAAARDQLTAAIATERRGDILVRPDDEAAGAGDRVPRIFPPAGPKLKRTRSWKAAGAIAGLVVAAGVAIALVIGSAAGPTPGTHRGPGPHHQPPVALTAAQWLATAAAAIANQRAPVPRPGQYIYTVIGQPHSTNNEGAWLSANGRKPAFFGQAGGHGGHIRIPPCPIPAAETGKCEFDAGYVPQMPTSPHALADFLVKVGIATKSRPPPHTKNWATATLGESIMTMFTSMDLSPRQRAALFRLMARTRGFVLVKRAVDAFGRTGTGIAWLHGGDTTTLIFDPHSYAFLGWNTHGRRGSPTDRVSLIKQVIVNRPPTFK